MAPAIEPEFMVFLADGHEGVGAVRQVAADHIVVYVENARDFVVARDAITDVHEKKVVLDPDRLDPAMLEAINHMHDREEPDLAG